MGLQVPEWEIAHLRPLLYRNPHMKHLQCVCLGGETLPPKTWGLYYIKDIEQDRKWQETLSPTVKDRRFQLTHLGFSEGQRLAEDTLKEPGIEEKDKVEVHQELTCMGGVV